MQPVLLEQILGGNIQVAYVVLAVVEEVAHLFEWSGPHRLWGPVGGHVTLGGPVALQFRSHILQPPVHGHHRLTHRGHPRHQLLELQITDVAARRLGEDLTEVCHQPRIGVRREIVRREIEALGQAQQHRHGHRSRVVLELIDVARRQIEHPRQGGLSEAAFLTQSA